ncbi:CHASE2 and HATPase_c domain-containing protein [Undibacterium oligocarboniphilum]|nr:CHASE2 and HATPase_c domain-containing protein [Undibacterium oligocarboniphilum]
MEHIAFREWLILSFLLLSLTASLIIFRKLEHADMILYDRFMQWNMHEARQDILVVAIDDYSLNELGKWPWPRQRHAQLLKQLNAANPAAIGLDILFTEEEPQAATDQISGDQLLADAMTQSNRVILPLIPQNTGKGLETTRPIPMLANAARQISHIHLEPDQDGITRSVFLREGMSNEWWPHFALAMKDVAQNIPSGTERYLPGQRLPLALRKSDHLSGVWQRDYRMYVPFSGGSGHFQSVPYVSVLRGEVPDSFIRNKYILIGPTAPGMTDSYPTPVSGNDGTTPGIEINANILASLLDERAIIMATRWQSMLYNLVIPLLGLIALQRLSPRKALLATMILLASTMTGSFLAMRYASYWLPPTGAVLALVVAYPLWSWRRLEAAIRYLGEEFMALDKEPHLMPELNIQDTPRPVLTDKLEQHINAMRIAAERVRDLRQFVSDSLASLPDATLVTTTDGNVLLSNQPALIYFASLGLPKVNDSLVPYLFSRMSTPQVSDNNNDPAFSWWNILDLQHTASMMQGVEVRDPLNHDLLIKSAPCYNAEKILVGWIISIIDITAIRAAERSRDETLHFISHDMRAPQASILALLEMQKDSTTALPQDELLSRIEKASRITLGLADNFVQLARAESQDYRFETIDFREILLDATEEMWSLARTKNIRLETSIPPGDYPVRADRALMTRVLTNLLSNAIKYSPRDTSVQCSLTLEQRLADATVICSIADHGYGIPRSEQNKLFQRFQRFKNADQPRQDGVGLGMVFIKAVLDRHHAQIDFTSVPNEGSTFNVKLPSTHL